MKRIIFAIIAIVAIAGHAWAWPMVKPLTSVYKNSAPARSTDTVIISGSSVTPSAQVVSISNGSPAYMTPVNIAMFYSGVKGLSVTFAATGALPSPLVAGTTYWIKATALGWTIHTASTCTTANRITTTNAGSGTFTVTGLGFAYASMNSVPGVAKSSMQSLAVNEPITSVKFWYNGPRWDGAVTFDTVPPSSITFGMYRPIGVSTPTPFSSVAATTITGIVNGLNTITLASPLSSRIGDFPGFSTVASDAYVYVDCLAANNAYAINANSYSESDTGEEFGVSAGGPTPSPNVLLYGQAPYLMAMGDSISVGPGDLEANGTIWSMGSSDAILGPFAYTKPFIYQVAQNFGWVYGTAAISGQTTTQIKNRFATDIVARKPKVVTLLCGVNNFWSGGDTTSSIIPDITNMLTQAQAAGIFVVCISMTPCNACIDGTYANMRHRIYSINQQIAALVATYSNAMYVDVQPLFGTYDSTNQLYVQNSSLFYDDGCADVHPLTAGHKLIADALSRAIYSHFVRVSALKTTLIPRLL